MSWTSCHPFKIFYCDPPAEFDPLPLSEAMAKHVQYPEPDTLGFDEIYVINLERRPERRLRMETSLRELGVAAKFIPAVDGR